MDSGEEDIKDSVEQKALRRQARRVHVESVAAGIVLTLPFLLLP
jgi:hypothetical protein